MSYQVLARKWRPRNFDDVVGQQHVVKALSNALDQDRLHHAYIFTGTRGVGKTTLARIVAKCLNCEQGVSSKPCGECSACVSVDEGRFIDLIEVDAASRAKVDETRDLMDNVQYAPSVGRFKIYLIDEVHMFSNHSFNALLKTLEEPPPHVKFLLATTEAKKIPVTILSRCLQFNLKHLTDHQITQQLEKITTHEAIESDHASLQLIARAAEGSLRDALSLLDQAVSHGGGVLDETQVRSMLGSLDKNEVSILLESLIRGDAEAVFSQVNHIADYNPDYDAILAELLSLLQQLAVSMVLENQQDTSTTESEISKLSTLISAEDLQLYYQMGLVGRRDLAYAPDPRAGFEMTLVRMLAFRPAQRVNMDTLQTSTTVVNRKQEQVETGVPVNVLEKNTKFSSANEWQSIIDEMALAGLVRELAGHCILREHTDDKIHLVLSPSQEHLLNSTQKDRLKAALKSRFGENISIQISVEEPESETPAERKVRLENEKQLAAEKSIQDDPAVKSMMKTFNATVMEGSVKPNTD